MEIIEPADLTTLDTMKKGFLDHLCFGTDDIEDTVAVLKKKGIVFNTEVTKYLNFVRRNAEYQSDGSGGENFWNLHRWIDSGRNHI